LKAKLAKQEFQLLLQHEKMLGIVSYRDKLFKKEEKTQ